VYIWYGYVYVLAWVYNMCITMDLYMFLCSCICLCIDFYRFSSGVVSVFVWPNSETEFSKQKDAVADVTHHAQMPSVGLPRSVPLV